MKKAIIVITSVFAFLFCLVSLILPRYKAEIYSLMYPQNISVESGDTLKTVSLKKGDCFSMGKFNGEEIIWEVIDDSGELLIWSRYAICFMAYDDSSSDWKSSNMRSWLNDEGESGFLSAANFTDSEKAMLATKRPDEKVFLLSAVQLKKIPEEKRAKAPTVSAIRNDGSDKLVIRKNCWYWTSSPIETNTSSVTTVTQSGGFYKTLSDDTLTGVCPAFYMNGNKIVSCAGDGSKEKPYIVVTEGVG